jgi:hypothetical protein
MCVSVMHAHMAVPFTDIYNVCMLLATLLSLLLRFDTRANCLLHLRQNCPPNSKVKYYYYYYCRKELQYTHTVMTRYAQMAEVPLTA